MSHHMYLPCNETIIYEFNMRLTGASALFLSLVVATLFSPSIGGDTLTPNQSLAGDEGILISAGGSFALGFFSPSGSTSRYIGIWYNKISVKTVVWVANRQRPMAHGNGTLSVLANGTLVIADGNLSIVWSSTSSSALRNPVAQLLDDGNFVVQEAGSDASDPNNFAWQSFDFPTDTLLPGMKLGWNLTTKFNRQLSSWKSETDLVPGQFTFGIDLHGDPQLYVWSGASELWRAGPWNGLWFTGLPQMQTYRNMLSFQFLVSDREVVYTFHMVDPKFVSRLMLNSSGTLHRMVWIEQDKYWNSFWIVPIDQCDRISPCGPYGVCDTSGSPMLCSCLPGFHPNNPESWALRLGTDGCVRKTALDCWNGTDGFVLVSGAKLPDTSSSMVDWGMSMEECRRECLKNCSCTAYSQANISGSGSGCIAWYSNLSDLRVYDNGGQDLYVRLAAADLGKESHHSPGNAAVIAVPIALAAFFLAVVAYCAWKKKKRKLQTGMSSAVSFREDNIAAENDSQNLDLPLFDLDTVISATGNFSIENKLGEGGFGPVYKGKLGDGEEIAVKRLSRHSVQGLDEFKNEIMLIAKLQHRNLVRLLGFCIEREERILIYEYLPNSSLDSFLFDEVKRVLLNWNTRSNIIIGIARGLLYLHQDSRLKIIHRDLKASNILLDLDMNPKISDFGMARIFGADEIEVTKRVVGTYGYMSPEYAMDGIFSVKSDVFSFGVLVLEIISGKKNREVYRSTQNTNLLGYAWSLWVDGKGLELVDESMSSSYPKAEALRFIKVGLLCVQERPEERPTMSTILLMLAGNYAMVPHPRQPGFVSIRGPCELGSYSSKNDSSNINNVSITMFEGR